MSLGVGHKGVKAGAITQVCESLFGNDIRRAEAAPRRLEHPADFGRILLDILREHVGKDRRQKHEIECAIVERELVLGGGMPTLRMVVPVMDVSDKESKVGVARRDLALAPLDSMRDDVESHILACGEVLGQWYGDSSDATADLEHAFVGFQVAELPKSSQELIADGLE